MTMYIEFETQYAFWYVHDGKCPENSLGPFSSYQDAANAIENAAD